MAPPDWKVVHVNATDDRGGAALACRRLHVALRDHGVESTLLLPDTSATGADDGAELARRHYVWLNRTELSSTHFSLALGGHDLSTHPAVRAADVVHLHWVATTQTPAGVRRLVELGKPVVWTMHDQAPFTGGCHYTSGCTGYQRECAACPQLRHDELGLPSAVLRDKSELFHSSNLSLVAPSQWIADQARTSRVFGRRHRIEVIANGVDVEVFAPARKEEARRTLGLPVDARYVLCFETQLERRKGGEELPVVLAEALAEARRKGVDASVLWVGPERAEVAALGARVVTIGAVHDDRTMACVYAAADVLLFPSHEDNLPNVVVEAVACGLPVVAYAVGGVIETIVDGVTGRLAPNGEPNALAGALAALLADPELRLRMSSAARDLALEAFDARKQAARMLDLYREVAGTLVAPPRRAAIPEPGPAAAKLVDRAILLGLESEVDSLREQARAVERVRMVEARGAALRTKAAAERIAELEQQLEAGNSAQTALEEVQRKLAESESDRAALEEVQRKLAESESDRAARLAVIEELQDHLGRAEQAAADRLVALEVSEAERARLAADVGIASALRARADGLRRAVRFDHWWFAKIPPLFAVGCIWLAFTGAGTVREVVALGCALLSVAAVASYGHVVNDAFDVESDRLAGKPNAMARRRASIRVGLAAFFVAVAFAPVAAGRYGWTGAALLGVNLLLPTIYSVPPVRLKERGAVALLCDAAGSHIVPTLFVLSALGGDWAGRRGLLAATLVAWSATLGLKGILHHQVQDRQSDLASHTDTFVTRLDEGRIERLLPAYNLFLELPLSLLLALEVIEPFPLALGAVGAYVCVELVKCWLGFEFAVTADLRDRRRSIPFANESLYTVWLPLAAAIQLALSSTAWLLATVALLGAFVPLYRGQLAELGAIGTALARARGAANAS